MPDIEIRPMIAGDLPRLMGMDHDSGSEYVWQLELRREAGQTLATFRDVRLPRPIKLAYPHDPYALADIWKRMAMLLVALSDEEPVGYVALLEQPPSAA